MFRAKPAATAAPTSGVPAERISIFALPFVLIARLFAVAVSLAIWSSIVLLVWIFIVLRTIALVSINNVMTVFRGGDVAPSRHLDQAVELWPCGFFSLLHSLGWVERSISSTAAG